MIEALSGMKFYSIILFVDDSLSTRFMTVCTYREKKTLEKLFHSLKNYKDPQIFNKELIDFSIDEVYDMKEVAMEMQNSGGIYCVETKSHYKSLEELAEEVILLRLSGLMDKELEGCPIISQKELCL